MVCRKAMNKQLQSDVCLSRCVSVHEVVLKDGRADLKT